MKSYQIRDEAKKYLTGGWKTFAISTVIYLVILVIVSYLPSLLQMPTLLSILIQGFMNILLSYGLFGIYFCYAKGQEIKCYEFLLIAFQNLKRALFIFFHTAIRLLIPFLLFITSFILVSSSITGSMLYALQDVESTPFFTIVFWCSIVLLVVSFIWFFTKSLYYTFSNLIGLEEPELSAKECVLKSKELMNHNRVKYLSLIASFIRLVFYWYLYFIDWIHLDFSIFPNVVNCFL